MKKRFRKCVLIPISHCQVTKQPNLYLYDSLEICFTIVLELVDMLLKKASRSAAKIFENNIFMDREA